MGSKGSSVLTLQVGFSEVQGQVKSFGHTFERDIIVLFYILDTMDAVHEYYVW